MDNNALIKHLSPLSSIVNAAIIDTHEDKGKVEQLFYHWGARGIKKLNTELFKSGKRRVLLPVNRNTHTATLPPDFDGEDFVGYIDSNGYKVPIKHNSNIAYVAGVENNSCDDKCPKCNSSRSACNDLSISSQTSAVVINGSNYEQTITKRMYPNGDYFLESYIPYFDAASGSVVYHTSKEFIAHIDLKPCGCIDETPANMEVVRVCNPDVYCSYYAPCACTDDNTEYHIFPESGLIQLSPSFKYSKVYIEYRGFLLKVNGQYQVPSAAFETLVEWIKYKYVDGNKSVSRFDKEYQRGRYVTEKRNLFIVLTRTSLSRILDAILTTPKFDISIDRRCYSNKSIPEMEIKVEATTDECEGISVSDMSDNQSPCVQYVPYSLSVIAGMPDAPVNGSSVYQTNRLKGAMNLDFMILNDTYWTIIAGDFTFDSNEGVIDISPNIFYTGDTLVTNYFKLT